MPNNVQRAQDLVAQKKADAKKTAKIKNRLKNVAAKRQKVFRERLKIRNAMRRKEISREEGLRLTRELISIDKQLGRVEASLMGPPDLTYSQMSVRAFDKLMQALGVMKSRTERAKARMKAVSKGVGSVRG